ncbi:putative albumin I chain a [Medicago truncatula]|nr:putative albumin I chain a [Medicago truncatula]
MKKVEACSGGLCSVFDKNFPRCEENPDCQCIPWGILYGNCIYLPTKESIVKVVEEHPNLCQSHVECTKKGSGSFCARYPDSKNHIGWCFTSNAEAERYFEVGSNPAINNFFKNMISNSNEKGFLKMPVEIST